MSGGERRLKDVAVGVPFVYGSIAFWLGRKADEFHTHRWNSTCWRLAHLHLTCTDCT